MKGDNWLESPSMSSNELSSVVIERDFGELAICWLDPAPLNGEAIGAEAKVRHNLLVFSPPVPRITGIAR